MIKTTALTLLSLTLAGWTAWAEPLTFDFKDPKGVNNAVFKLDAPLEAFTGSANGISGSVTFDPQKPEATKGKIIVASKSLHLGNPMQLQHMQSEKWLDVAKYPEISFEAKSVSNCRGEGDSTQMEVAGTFTLKGIAKDITVPIKVTYLKDKLGQRVPNQKGDLLVIRASFSIKRSDFGINPGQFEDKVSDAIELTLSIAGAAPR